MLFSAGKMPIFHLLLSKGFFLVYFIQNEFDQRACETKRSLARDFETQTSTEIHQAQNYSQSNDAHSIILFPHATSAATLSFYSV